MNGAYQIHWIKHGDSVKTAIPAEQLFIDEDRLTQQNGSIITNDTTDCEELFDGDDHNIDHIAAENLILMAQDGQVVNEIIATTDENGTVVVSASDCTQIDCDAVMQHVANISEQLQQDPNDLDYVEEYIENEPQIIGEEVIADECVEISAEQIIGSTAQALLDIEASLPSVQDEYTAMRPYPCDFCSRRFRKKSSLMNHMVAHQNDRPHLCKLCGSRFFRRSDLINHLKAHADMPEPEYDDATFNNFANPEQQNYPKIQDQSQQQHYRSQEITDHYYEHDWNISEDSMVLSSRNSQQSHTASGNSSSTSTSTVKRGRVSRLKPKEEFYNDNCNKELNQNADEADYIECDDLQPSTAAVKLTQDANPKIYPVIDDNKPFVCQECGLAFSRQKAFLSHSKNHRKETALECSQCNEIFWDAADLLEHQKQHTFDDSNSEYDPNDEIDEVQSDSETERMYGEFYCSECGMCFHRQDLLRRHSKVHKRKSSTSKNFNDIEDQHCCNTCGETFVEALDLLAHAEMHARFPPFKCVLCGESFMEEFTIKRHLQSSHANEMKTNSCILCGKECRDRKALIKHAWDHSREKCHSCSKCGKNFHNKARLKRHMASHRDKSVVCDVCQEEFPDGRSLSNHRHSHSANATGKLFPCHECGKTFGSRSSQQIHLRIHTGERPYGCQFCWKAFADGGTLRKHERIHTGEKPYGCSVCPRAFNQRVVLREHIRSHHSSIDTKRGTYFCTVCEQDFNSSNDLISHLIQHSDNNTAKKRQPITGPRKYKRRRKLTEEELARLRQDIKQDDGNESAIEISDFEIDNVDDLLNVTETSTPPKPKRTRKKETTEKVEKQNNIIDSDNNRNKNQKERYNSISSNKSDDKTWQTRLLNRNSNEDTYKSFLYNMETTLQTIDTLVVGPTDNNSNSSGSRNNNNNSIDNIKNDNDRTSIAQRTEALHYKRNEPTVDVSKQNTYMKTRKKSTKLTKTTRPRMIHTQKQITNKKRSNKSNTSTIIHKKNSHVNDYDIIMPDTQLPKQISSNSSYVKQEPNTRITQGDLYDAHLLLEASSLRKEAYEKFNPSIVQDLEEILRSPIKCDKTGGRHRYISESSAPQIVNVEEQHLIKIEPTSPDLRDIVAGSSTTNELTGHRTKRSSRLIAPNRKYLDYEVESTSLSTNKRNTNNNSNKNKTNNNNNNNNNKNRKSYIATNATETYLNYNIDNYSNTNNADINTKATYNTEVGSSSILSVENTSNVVETNVTTTPIKRRFFECEMCSAVFADRAQLLDHVPIHI